MFFVIIRGYKFIAFIKEFVVYFKKILLMFQDKVVEKRRKLEDFEEEQKFNNDVKDLVNKN